MRVDVESVTDVGVRPVLDRVGNLLRCSENGALPSGEIVVHQLLYGKTIRLSDTADVVATVLDDLVVGRNLVEQFNGEWLIGVKFLDWNTNLR